MFKHCIDNLVLLFLDLVFVVYFIRRYSIIRLFVAKKTCDWESSYCQCGRATDNLVLRLRPDQDVEIHRELRVFLKLFQFTFHIDTGKHIVFADKVLIKTENMKRLAL